MANEVKVKVIMDDDGTLRLTEKSAKKLGLQLDNLGKQSVQANRGLKGVAQAGANTTKNFSKMAGTLNGVLVPAYATVAATVFAATAVVKNFQKAAQVDNLIRGLDALGAASGRNLSSLAMSLREATDGAISLEQSLRATALASSAGIGSEEFLRLGEVARNASVALGRDLSDSLDRLTRGVAKLEPEILDELGLIIRVDEASEKYAATLGKTASQLTNFQKRQAFLNEAIIQGEEKFGEIGKSVPVDGFTKLSASLQDVLKSISSFINRGAEPLAAFLAEAPGLIFAVGLAFAGTITKQILPSLKELSVEAEKSATSAKESLAEIDEGFKAESKERLQSIKNIAVAEKSRIKLSAKELVALEKGNNLEELRTKAVRARASAQAVVTKGEKENSKIGIVALETNRAVVREQRELVALIDAEIAARGQAVALSESQARATANAQAAIGLSQIRQETLGALDDDVLSFSEKTKKGLAGVSSSFKTVRGELDLAPAKFGRATKAVNIFRAGAAAAGTAVQFFGTALLRFVPFLGAAIIAFELLGGILSSVSNFLGLTSEKATAAAEAVEELAESTRESTIANSKAVEGLRERIENLQQEEQTLSNILKLRSLENQINLINVRGYLDSAEAVKKARMELEEYNKTAGVIQKISDFLGIGSDREEIEANISELVVNGLLTGASPEAVKAFKDKLNSLVRQEAGIFDFFATSEDLANVLLSENSSQALLQRLGSIRNVLGTLDPSAIEQLESAVIGEK